MFPAEKYASSILCVVGLFCGATQSHAARDAENVTIATVGIGKTTGNYVFIRATVSPVGTTSCHNNNYWHYTLSLDDAMGKNMYAMLLAAAAGKQAVNLSGLDLCNEFAGVESLRAISVVY